MNDAPAAVNNNQMVASAWRDQAVWSEVANRLKTDLFKWRKLAAVAGVLGAFLETLAATLTILDNKWWWLRALIALAGAVILAVVPYVVRTKLSKDRVSDWVRARSAAEAFKEMIYRYLVGAPPFSSADSPGEFIERRQKLNDAVEDLNIHAAVIKPPQRERPLTLTIDDYIKYRVDNQINNYYLSKAREKALTAQKFHSAEFALGLFAVVMGAIASAAAAKGLPQLSVFAPWVAVVTTAGSAVTAHLAAARYDHEAIIYFGTAGRLTNLRDKWLVDLKRMEPVRIAKFVDDCEHAISTENESWLARWTRKQPNNENG